MWIDTLPSPAMDKIKKVYIAIAAIIFFFVLCMTISLVVNQRASSSPQYSCHNNNNTTSALTPTTAGNSSTTTITDYRCDVEGELQVDKSCTIQVCQQGCLRLYQGSEAPNISTSELLSHSCLVWVKSRMNWISARSNCIDLGGDLYVAGDFAGTNDYLLTGHSHNELVIGWVHHFDCFSLSLLSVVVWIGARNRTWLDGRTVTEWHSKQPDEDPTFCAWLSPRRKGLYDVNCNHLAYSLCQMKVYYG
ncbi:hypothetical protein Pcinc_008939 [Petrolisthes cinctipes]|uniref:C-type lectin domain-containing protein n=1 Tax=Petrolisthes cinctipes TaxID=88211 RepID=A0AAE1KYZ9_PETCI|nr:hypothetical protein Pcinc_008939 [Petrolisthes cinctipes]